MSCLTIITGDGPMMKEFEGVGFISCYDSNKCIKCVCVQVYVPL